ncbi:hypothetical protein EGW08_008661, partial [Elysia chlorotica]
LPFGSEESPELHDRLGQILVGLLVLRARLQRVTEHGLDFCPVRNAHPARPGAALELLLKAVHVDISSKQRVGARELQHGAFDQGVASGGVQNSHAAFVGIFKLAGVDREQLIKQSGVSFGNGQHNASEWFSVEKSLVFQRIIFLKAT